MMKKIISFVLCLCLLVGMLPLAVFAAYEDENGVSGGVTLDKEDAFPAIRDAFSEYLVNEVHIEQDKYLGIPVDLYVYAKVGKGSETAPVVQYVINTNTERLGTESDVSILTDMIEEYIVVVVDYRNNSLTTAVNVDMSTHQIQWATVAGTYLTYEDENGATKSLNIIKQCDNWILPAGYRLMRDIPYFNFKEHGVEGTLEQIVKVWNQDFSDTTHAGVRITWGQKTTEDGRLVFNDENGTRCYENSEKNGYVYDNGSVVSGAVTPEYKKLREGASYVDADARIACVKDTWAEDWWDCVKKDGTPIDLNLYLDIMYPSEPKDGVETPVLAMAVSRQSTTGNWYSSSENPEYLGAALFDGYSVLLYEYAYVPMARRDHYGYFSDSPKYPDTTSVDWKYGVSKWVGARASRAAIRTFRYYCDTLSTLEAVNANQIGLVCISKTGYNVFLGNENPDIIPEQKIFFEGQDESQPQPYLTYDDGTPIPTGVQAVYTVSGAAPENMLPGFCPVYVSVGMQDSTAYSNYYKTIRLNAKRLDIESVHYSLPLLGHAYLAGMNEEYNVDTYQSVMDFFHYHVAGREGAIEYITPLSGSTNVGTTDTITVKFNASVSLATVQNKVKIVNAKTGVAVTGSWSSLYGNTEWRFVPDGLEGGETYLVYVPEDTVTEDGRTMKTSKTSAFVTVPEKNALAGTVSSANGVKTVTDKNKVFFLFDSPDTEGSTSEILRFTVTNEKAAQMLSVYALSEINENDPSASTLGEKIGSIAIAGAGAYEIDITDYLASVPNAEAIGFALVGERTVGTTTLHNETYDTASSTSTLKGNSSTSTKLVWSSLYDKNATGGGSLQLTKTGSSYQFSNALGFGSNAVSNTMSESDLGRLFRVRMSVLVTEENAPQYFKTFIGYNNPERTGVGQYVDWEDTTFTVVHPMHTPGEWVDIDFYYLVDDPTYTAENIQKCYLATTSTNGVIYIDNYIVEEIVSEVSISDAIAPTIVTHPSTPTDTTLLQQLLLQGGSAGDIYFGTSDELVIRGETASMSQNGSEKVYIKLDLESIDADVPATISINVLSSKGGRISFYGITDKALGESWTKETISWANAPANDRFGPGVDETVTTLLQNLTIANEGIYNVDVWDFTCEMRDKGAKTATVIAVLETVPDVLVLEENFNEGKPINISTSSSGGTPKLGASSTLPYPDGGEYSYEVLANSTHSRVLFKLGDPFTSEDLGKTYKIIYNMYSVDGGSYKACMRPSTTELQGATVAIEAGVWTEQVYTFTVTREMLDATPTFALISTRLGSLTSTEGAATSTFYVDNLRYYSSAGEIRFEILETTVKEEDPYIVNADFDNTTVKLYASGNAKPYIGVGPNNVAYSGTQTMYWTATGNTQRPMLHLFDAITEDMVGKQYEVSYMFYSTGTGYFNTYPRMVPKINGTSTSKEFRANGNPVKITYTEANKWQKVTTVITVTQEMYALADYPDSSLRIALEPYGLGASSSNPVTCYVDDLKVLDLTPADDTDTEGKEPHYYKQTFTDAHNAVGSGFEYTQHGSNIFLVNEGDRMTGGDGALKVLANRNYNRILFKNIIDNIGFNTTSGESWAEGATSGCLTSDDIGRTFRVSFYIKSDTVGSFNVLIANHKANVTCTTAQSYEIKTVNEWTKIVYEFTVNESMVNNRQACLVLRLSSFDYTADGETLRTLWIDDLTSVEVVEGVSEGIATLEAATISNRKVVSAEELVVDRTGSLDIAFEGVSATLVRFAPDLYRNTTSATLKLSFLKANGQTLKIWALNVSPDEEATFNSLPFLNRDGTLKQFAVYGGAPLATIRVDSTEIDIDIEQYALSRDNEELVFVITSDESATSEPLYASFSTCPAVIGKDITSSGELRTEGGKLQVAGNDITFHYLTSYQNTALKKGVSYTFRLKVEASENAVFTLSAANTSLCANKTVQNGELVFDFVPTADGVTALTLTASESNFSILSYTLNECGENAKLTSSSFSLYIADCTSDLSSINGALANMTLTEDATLSIYVPNDVIASLSSLTLDGVELNLEALSSKDGYRIVRIEGIAIKDLAKYHTIVFTYSSGTTRTIDVSAMEYLARLIASDEESLELRRLVYALVGYAREAQGYFLGSRALPYEIAYTAILDEYVRYQTKAEAYPEAAEMGELSEVVTDAAIHLADAPEYLFRISDTFTGTLTLTVDGATGSYEIVNGLVGGENIIVFRPRGIYAAASTVSITATGTANASGEYNLSSYRAAAENASLSKVVKAVDALYTYVEAAKEFVRSTQN